MKNIREIGKHIIQELETTVSGVVDEQAQDCIWLYDVGNESVAT